MVGSLLMYAILITTAVTVRVGVVPNLDEQREAGEMVLVAERFANLKSSTEHQLGEGSRGSLSTLIPLRDQAGASLMSNGQSATFLQFTPGSRNVTLEARELRVQSQNGDTVFGAHETWTNVSGTTTINDILDIHHLRVRVQDPQGESNGDSITLAILDRNGAFAGDLTVYLNHHPSGYSVNVRVRSADTDVLYDQGSSHFNQDRPLFYWVDALADHVQFSDVVGRSAAPFSLQVSEAGLNGAFTMVYMEDTPGGRVLVGSGGDLHHDWSQQEAGGALRYEAPNLRFISQEFTLENGAVITEQPVGDTFLAEPGMRVERTDDRTALWLTLPALTGRAGDWSGRQGVSVDVSAGTASALMASAPHFAMNVTTAHPHVWTSFWNGRFAAAGLAPGEYTLTSGEGWARFDLHGHDPAPTSTVHDLAIVLNHGSVVLAAGG